MGSTGQDADTRIGIEMLCPPNNERNSKEQSRLNISTQSEASKGLPSDASIFTIENTIRFQSKRSYSTLGNVLCEKIDSSPSTWLYSEDIYSSIVYTQTEQMESVIQLVHLMPYI